ncbi:CBO0543 family protein [Salicibibacter kimchii]|uniref:CBO0543 family protein n=1 Tax=Salicibibacter kimchii TaxID=2099786 RepID=UPI00135751E1|nr:CBO0543 family protein [Salicibibacter kimchii]
MLKVVFATGIFTLPFTFLRRNVKDHIIIFLVTGYAATFLAQLVVRRKKLKYPVRPWPNYFDTNILYEYLLLPLVSVWFNQTTRRSGIIGTLGQAVLYGTAHTVIETIIEKKTRLMQWKTWSVFHNISSIASVLLGSKGILFVIRWLSKRFG